MLQSPHHGSKTSSSEPFVAALAPKLAVISSGYLNRFHHPHPDVVARYDAHAIDVLNTATSGFIALRFAPDAAPRIVERGRVDRHPYWRE